MNLVVVVLSVSMQSSASIPVCGILHNRYLQNRKRLGLKSDRRRGRFAKHHDLLQVVLASQVSGWMDFLVGARAGCGFSPPSTLEGFDVTLIRYLHINTGTRYRKVEEEELC